MRGKNRSVLTISINKHKHSKNMLTETRLYTLLYPQMLIISATQANVIKKESHLHNPVLIQYLL